LEFFNGFSVAQDLTAHVGSRQESAQKQPTGLDGGKVQAASFVKAEALWTLQQHQEARAAWQDCAETQNQSMSLAALCAWKRVRNAEENTTDASVDVLLRVAQHPQSRSPELLWLAAFTKYYAGSYTIAKQLAEDAIQLSCFGGECLPHGRVRLDKARFEWPYDVLYYSLLQLGDTASAEQAKVKRDRAKETRLKLG
jgi:hypothetical protein